MASTDRDDHLAATGSDNTTPTQPTGDSPSSTLDRGSAETLVPEQGDSGNGHAPGAESLTPVAALPVRAARRVVLADPAPPPAEIPANNGAGETGEPAHAGAPAEAHETNGRYQPASPSIAAPPGEIGPAAGTATAGSRVATAVADPPTLAEPLAPPPAPAGAPAPAATGRRGAVSRSALWRSRALLLGGVALGMAIYAQQLVNLEHAIIPAIRWYAGAILVMILAWLGTYKNKSFLVVPLRPLPAPGPLPVRAPARAERRRIRLSFGPWRRLLARYPAAAMVPRYLLAAGALALNLYSVGQLRAANYDSAVGGIGWAISLVVLIVAFLGHNPAPKRSADAGSAEVEERTDFQIPRKLEIAIFIAILLLAFAMRFYRLDDWTTGMHGDEGEAGMDATA